MSVVILILALLWLPTPPAGAVQNPGRSTKGRGLKSDIHLVSACAFTTEKASLVQFAD